MNSFAERLIDWYTGNKRDLPWRQTKEPYPVWLSEIILQQTRVEQGLPYWERFMQAFPRIIDLANAEQARVLRLWQGLGYYSRARNMHDAAKYIRDRLGGQFPSTYEEILKLKGVGPYTAAAIASICYDEATPVVDGNVFRFASRYFGITEDIALSKSRKIFEKELFKYISIEDPGSFNQGMMEFGARVCSPSPNCMYCPFQPDCYAFQQSKQKDLPVKTKKLKVRERFFNYLVILKQDQYFMNARTTKDIWTGLYDFFLVEKQQGEEEVLSEARQLLKSNEFILNEVSDELKHVLSHQIIHARFYLIEIHETLNTSALQNLGLSAYSTKEMLTLPKPKLIVNYLKQLGIN